MAILTQHHIGGAPVVTAEGAVVGVISELALIDVVFDSDAKDSPVSEYMTPEVHTVHPDDPLSRPAQFFALYSFRRLPVVEDGKLVGIVTRRDLMNYAPAREPASDRSPARVDPVVGTNDLISVKQVTERRTQASPITNSSAMSEEVCPLWPRRPI